MQFLCLLDVVLPNAVDWQIVAICFSCAQVRKHQAALHFLALASLTHILW